jgi:membrane protease subunit HflC
MSPLPINHPLVQALRRLGDVIASPAGATLGLLAAIAILGCAYTVDQAEQVVITQFGRPVGGPINADGSASGPGLHFKIPFVQAANRFEKRILEWDGPAAEMTTLDKLYVVVDTFARWRIKNPLIYLQSLRDERSAISRLDDIIGSETRNVVARHDLIELVRSDKTRNEKGAPGDPAAAAAGLPPIRFGRHELEREILAAAREKVGIWGIELLDVRVKRINYKPGVIEKIYDRMISERLQIAERFRSEGAGEAAKIAGRRDRDLQEIQSASYRRVQEIRGKADARASEIYARAYTAGPAAGEFYTFLKTLDMYRETLGRDSTLILTTDSDLFRLLKSAAPPPR